MRNIALRERTLGNARPSSVESPLCYITPRSLCIRPYILGADTLYTLQSHMFLPTLASWYITYTQNARNVYESPTDGHIGQRAQLRITRCAYKHAVFNVLHYYIETQRTDKYKIYRSHIFFNNGARNMTQSNFVKFKSDTFYSCSFYVINITILFQNNVIFFISLY